MNARLLAVACAAALLAPALAAAPATADDPAHEPAVKCSAYVRTDGTVVFAGVAHAAAGHAPVVETTVRCTYTAANGRYTSANTAPAPVVWAYTRGNLKGPIQVCESATAVYADGHVGTVAERCDPPVTPTPLPGEQLAGAQGGCAMQRQSGRWVVAAYGAAPVRAAPAVSTLVRCVLTDATGAEITAEEAFPAPWAAAAEALPGSFTTLRSRCWEVSVLYADNARVDAGDCEAWA